MSKAKGFFKFAIIKLLYRTILEINFMFGRNNEYAISDLNKQQQIIY